jgi:hypothetical protein
LCGFLSSLFMPYWLVYVSHVEDRFLTHLVCNLSKETSSSLIIHSPPEVVESINETDTNNSHTDEVADQVDVVNGNVLSQPSIRADEKDINSENNGNNPK